MHRRPRTAPWKCSAASERTREVKLGDVKYDGIGITEGVQVLRLGMAVAKAIVRLQSLRTLQLPWNGEGLASENQQQVNRQS
jgi:hypothetical protein